MGGSFGTVAALKRELADLLTPGVEQRDDYQIAAAVGTAFLARARSGAPTLLVPLKTAPVAVGRRGGGFSLNPVSRVVFEHEGRRWEQPAATLECTENQLIDAFLVLVVDIARRLRSSGEEDAWEAIVRWVEEWQVLLTRRVVLTTEQQLGLWGELWIVSVAGNPDSLVEGWRGPEREATDFFLGGIALEVKASRRAHVHHVSLRQVDLPVGVHESYLLSMWVGIDPVHGVSLAELVDKTLARAADAPALLKQVTLLGYTPRDRDQYPTRFVLLELPIWFRAKHIPRVREIDAGVSRVRYEVTLDIDKAVSDDFAMSLWHHFCGGRPSVTTHSIQIS
jgi:hypothetical protein